MAKGFICVCAHRRGHGQRFCVCSCVCARASVRVRVHGRGCGQRFCVCVLRRGAQPKAGPGLTLLALRAHVASLTQTQATDGITAPVASAAVAEVAAVRSPVTTITGCNRTQSHPEQAPMQATGTTAKSGTGASQDWGTASCKPPVLRGPGRRPLQGLGKEGRLDKGRAKGPCTSLTAKAGPPRGTAAVSGGWVAVPIIGTRAPCLAAGTKPACWAHYRQEREDEWGLAACPGSKAQGWLQLTHHPGSGCRRSQGGTGRLQSQGRSGHRAGMLGRSPGSPAPSGPRDNLAPTPHGQSVPKLSLFNTSINTTWHNAPEPQPRRQNHCYHLSLPWGGERARAPPGAAGCGVPTMGEEPQPQAQFSWQHKEPSPLETGSHMERGSSSREQPVGPRGLVGQPQTPIPYPTGVHCEFSHLL